MNWRFGLVIALFLSKNVNYFKIIHCQTVRLVTVLHNYNGVNITSQYVHLSRYANIYVGMPVTEYTVLGYMGSTGNSTGAHLHFGIKKGTNYVDPLPYLLGEKDYSSKGRDRGIGLFSIFKWNHGQSSKCRFV